MATYNGSDKRLSYLFQNGGGGGGGTCLYDANKVDGIDTNVSGLVTSVDSANLKLNQIISILTSGNSIAKWNFKNSYTDEINGYTASGGTRSNSGLQLTGKVTFPAFLMGVATKYRIKFGTVSANFAGTNPRNLFIFEGSSGYEYQYPGLRWNAQNSCWALYDTVHGNQNSSITNVNAFSNKEVVIEISGAGIWTISIDGTTVFTSTYPLALSPIVNGVFGAQNSSYIFYTAYIEEFEIIR